MDPQPFLIALSLIAGLILLLICPSRAGMWRAVRLFAADHEEANLLIDRRRDERRKAKVVVVLERKAEMV